MLRSRPVASAFLTQLYLPAVQIQQEVQDAWGARYGARSIPDRPLPMPVPGYPTE